MGCEASNLVSESLGLNDSNIIDDSLVGVEVICQLLVVLFDDESGRSLDRLSFHTAHFSIK